MFLLIDKPKGMTSHDVVAKVRRITGEKRVGHGGTLDPNATGLLIVGVGRESTKQLGTIAKDMAKSYLAELILGEERTTDDVEGDVVKTSDRKPSEEAIRVLLLTFLGKQLQTPPIFSALKVNGQTAYNLARKGKAVQLEPREIEVTKAEFVHYDYPSLEILFEVSSGTYIRSLAKDIGTKLNSYAYLGNLRRTAIGKFSLDDAVHLEDLDKDNWKNYTKTLR